MASPSPALPAALLLLLLVSSAARSPSTSPAPLPSGFSAPEQADTNLPPILSNLGFQELAIAVRGLSSSLFSVWTGPITIFAPSDDSLRSCNSCSPTRVIREHAMPGLFSLAHLSAVPFGVRLETASPGRCLTVTAAAGGKIFVDGVQITRPDLFNDGRVAVHGIQGLFGPLSPISCSQSPRLPPPHDETTSSLEQPGFPIVRPMIRDAIAQLRESGYSILAMVMRVNHPELSTLENMTIFALDDAAIFSGGHSYVVNMRFHVVPNRLLTHADLIKLKAGAVLHTLVRGQSLVITHAHTGDTLESGLRINNVPISRPDVVSNLGVVVHRAFLPFPHLLPADMPLLGGAIAADSIFEPPAQLPAGLATPTSPMAFHDSL